MTSMLDALKLLEQRGEQAAAKSQPPPSAEEPADSGAAAVPDPAPAAPVDDAARPATTDPAGDAPDRSHVAIEAELDHAAQRIEQEAQPAPAASTRRKQAQSPARQTAAQIAPSTASRPKTAKPTPPPTQVSTTVQATGVPTETSQALGGTEIAGLVTIPTIPTPPPIPTQPTAARQRSAAKPPAAHSRKRAARMTRRRTGASRPQTPSQPPPQTPNTPPVAIRQLRPEDPNAGPGKEKRQTFADKMTSINADGTVRRPGPAVAPPISTTEDVSETMSIEVVPHTKDGTPKQDDAHPITRVAPGTERQPQPTRRPRSTQPTLPPSHTDRPATREPTTVVQAATETQPNPPSTTQPNPLSTKAAVIEQPIAPAKEVNEGRRHFEKVLNELRAASLLTDYRNLWKRIDREDSDRSIMFVDCEDDRPAAELLVYLAGSGKDSRSILLIDGDLQSRHLTRLLRSEHELGLTDCPDLQQMGQVLQETGLPSTRFLPVGQNTGNIDSQHMAFILSELTNMFDFAFVAGGNHDNPLLGQLKRIFRESYLVVRLGTTMREAALDAVSSFGSLDIKLSGCVVANLLADPTIR